MKGSVGKETKHLLSKRPFSWDSVCSSFKTPTWRLFCIFVLNATEILEFMFMIVGESANTRFEILT